MKQLLGLHPGFSDASAWCHFKDISFWCDDVCTSLMEIFVTSETGNISFHGIAIICFQGLFRNYGDSVLPLFKPHIERLASDPQESSQRCLTEIVAGLMRGSKHWGFLKVQSSILCI